MLFKLTNHLKKTKGVNPEPERDRPGVWSASVGRVCHVGCQERVSINVALHHQLVFHAYTYALVPILRIEVTKSS